MCECTLGRIRRSRAPGPSQSLRTALPCSSLRCALASKNVDHSCQQCGTTVEDGRPFCPQCRAPQISVKVAEPTVAEPLSLMEGSTIESMQSLPSAHSDRVILSAGTPVETNDSRIAVRAVLWAGLLGVFIGAIPIVGILLTGGLAVFFYRRKSGLGVPASLGVRLGGAAGVVVFAIGALFAVTIIAMHAQQQCVDAMVSTLQKFGADTADPRVQASLRDVFTPSGQLMSFLVTVVFAAIGGAIASVFMGPRNPRL